MADIHHIEGQYNRAADAISGNFHIFKQSLIDLEALAIAQSHDKESQRLRTSTTSLCLEHIRIPDSQHTFLCDVSKAVPDLRYL